MKDSSFSKKSLFRRFYIKKKTKKTQSRLTQDFFVIWRVTTRQPEASAVRLRAKNVRLWFVSKERLCVDGSSHFPDKKRASNILFYLIFLFEALRIRKSRRKRFKSQRVNDLTLGGEVQEDCWKIRLVLRLDLGQELVWAFFCFLNSKRFVWRFENCEHWFFWRQFSWKIFLYSIFDSKSEKR